MAKPTKESVYEEIRKAGTKGKKISAKLKIPFLEELSREGKVVKVGSLYCLPEYVPDQDEVYRKIERAGEKGTKLTPLEAEISKHMLDEGKIVKVGSLYYLPEYFPGSNEVYTKIRRAGEKGTKLTPSEVKIAKSLLDEGEIAKVGSLYCLPEYVPDPDEVYKKIERARESGTDLAPLEIEVIKPLTKKGKVKKVGKKYYVPDYEPLTREKVIEKLLNNKVLKRVEKKYIFLPKSPESIPSFAEFVETLQKIYLRKAGGYRKSINIVSLVEAVTSEMDVPRKVKVDFGITKNIRRNC
ncbi:MAG: hypothetical protein HXS54_06785 [Theionarchaea archaeon]|nr:hypothetical protein [Theionarchaea archaeon]